MDDDPRKRSIKELGWQSWLTNGFWAYYKWYFFVGVFAITFLVMTVVSYARQDRADLVLTYVYSSAPDEAQAEAVRRAFAEKAKPEGGRGAVKVKVEAVPLRNEKGERLLFGELQDPDRMIYVMDDASVSFFQELGYFGLSWGIVPGTELYAALRDAPVVLYRLEDFADQGYKQEQIDESNEYLIRRHAEQVEAARELVTAVMGY